MEAAIGFATDLVGAAAGAAFVAALGVTAVGRLLFRNHRGRIGPWGVALGFLAGYWLLPRDFAGFQPTAIQPWQFLPFAAAGAALAGCFVPEPQRPKTSAAVTMVATGILAVLLAPSWPVWGYELPALRGVALAYLLLVGLALVFLARRVSGHILGAALAVAAFGLALAAGAVASIRFGQLAAIAACGLAGASIGSLIGRPTAAMGHRSIAIYVVLVGGLAWIACVEPEPPMPGLLIVPLLPAALWLLVVLGWKPSTPGDLPAEAENRPPP